MGDRHRVPQIATMNAIKSGSSTRDGERVPFCIEFKRFGLESTSLMSWNSYFKFLFF